MKLVIICHSRSNNTVNNTMMTLWESDLFDVNGIAFDWIHRNLYWTDSSKNSIQVLSLSSSGAQHRTLIQSNLDRPRAIVVDPRVNQ